MRVEKVDKPGLSATRPTKPRPNRLYKTNVRVKHTWLVASTLHSISVKTAKNLSQMEMVISIGIGIGSAIREVRKFAKCWIVHSYSNKKKMNARGGELNEFTHKQQQQIKYTPYSILIAFMCHKF